jgi:hypothetical protein
MTEKILRMWNEGTSLGTIAKQLNMTVDMASRLLVKAMVWRNEQQ